MTRAPDPAEVRAREVLESALAEWRVGRNQSTETFLRAVSPVVPTDVAINAIRTALASATEAPPVAGMGAIPVGPVWDALCNAAGAYSDFVAAREAMNAARPVDQINATPAEYALYDERHKVDHAAEREHFRTAILLAQVAEQIVANQFEAALTKPTPPASVDDDCDLCFGIMSRACPRCNPCAVEGTPPASVSGEVVVETISEGLAVRIHTLLATLSADDFRDPDIGAAYADEARELVQVLAAAPEAATPSAVDHEAGEDQRWICPRDRCHRREPCPDNLAFQCDYEPNPALATDKAPSAGLDRVYRCHHCKRLVAIPDWDEQCPHCHSRAFSKIEAPSAVGDLLREALEAYQSIFTPAKDGGVSGAHPGWGKMLDAAVSKGAAALAAAYEAAAPPAASSEQDLREEATLDEVYNRILEGTFYHDYDWAAGPALRVLRQAAERDKAPSAVGGVDRMREAVVRIIMDHVVDGDPESPEEAADQIIASGETSPVRGEG